MAEETEDKVTPPEPDKEENPVVADGESALGDAGKRALDALRAEKKAIAAKLAEYEKDKADREEASKTEEQKRTEAHAALSTRAEKAEQALLRLQVAHEAGLTPAQAKRLVGTTKEELEADAAEIADLFTPATPNTRSRPKLRGGSTPNEEPEETDPVKLAALIKR
jgi:hypothetical protein